MFRNPYVQIHICVLLWGFTAILGKLINLSAIPLVFWRVLIVSVCLLLWLPVWRQLARMSRDDLGIAALNGAIITIHWLFFYGAIKAANASVAATCMALAPVFLSIIEPLWRKQTFVGRDMLIAAIAVPGVALVVGGIPDNMTLGLFFGVMAALLAAVFSLISKGLALRAPALALTTVQMAAGMALLGLLIPLWPLLGDGFTLPERQDMVWLFILAIACTLVPFTLTLIALRKISAFSVQLAVNLEPVYTIFLAALIFAESDELGWSFYAGVAIILGAVLWHVRAHRGTATSTGQ
jgi:drug/metabolite transporter (DMT)-like permease